MGDHPPARILVQDPHLPPRPGRRQAGPVAASSGDLMVNSRRRPRRPAAGRPHPRATGDGRGHSDGRVSICKMPSGPLLAHPLRGRHPGVGAQGRHRRRPEGHRGAAAWAPSAGGGPVGDHRDDPRPSTARRCPPRHARPPRADGDPVSYLPSTPRGDAQVCLPRQRIETAPPRANRRSPTPARRVRLDRDMRRSRPGGTIPNTARVTVSSSAGRGPLRVGSPPDQAGIPSPTSARRLRPMAGRRRPRTCPSAGRRAVSRPTYSEIGRMTLGSGLAGGNRRARARRC